MTSLQVETFEQEKRKLVGELEEVYKRHKEDMEIQELQYFQVHGVSLWNMAHTHAYTHTTVQFHLSHLLRRSGPTERHLRSRSW